MAIASKKPATKSKSLNQTQMKKIKGGDNTTTTTTPGAGLPTGKRMHKPY